MRYWLLLPVLLLTWTSARSQAVADQPTTEPMSDPYRGIRLQAPDGWVGQAVEGGFIFGSHTIPGLLLVLFHDLNSLDALRAEAQQGLVEDDGTMLRLSSPLEPFGERGLRGEYEGTIQGQAARVYAIGLLSPHGGGVTILAATEANRYTDVYAGYAEALARSVVFTAPQTPSVVDEWRQRLSGMRLTYLSSYYSGGVDGAYVGSSSEATIDLCQAGYFLYGSSSSLSVDGGFGSGYNASGYSGGRDQGQGQWEVVHRGGQSVLLLRFHDGRTHEYTLTDEDGKTFLNGERYYRTGPDAPVAEHRPNCR
ncbi:hypothetical protein AWN76_013005 [Rhodothermaceae bacterium RA]|nr:hypothetical protein AWN76_013005 [Rhodothermaceae bacterium RA]